jgi:hypothetical protein
MSDELEQTETRGRKPRQQREAEQKKVSWRPPELLPSPSPEEGYVFRWIRISALGHDDVSNISARLREGYEPVKASEHPEVQVIGSLDGRFKDCIIYGGLMLCKIPQEIAEQRDAYYREQARAQLKSVDNNFMRENDSRMPLFNERKSETNFGNGSSS